MLREQKLADAISLTDYPNKPLEAYYIETKTVDTKFGEQNLHVFEKPDGKRVSVWGFTALNRLLEMTKKGVFCKVTYTGLSKEKNKYGKQVHTCTLFFDDEKHLEGVAQEPEETEESSPLPF